MKTPSRPSQLLAALILLALTGSALAAPAAAERSAAAETAEMAENAEPPTGADVPLSESEILYRQALQSITEGRRQDASATLSQVIERMPQHAGAWLELALIQCALGHGDEAQRLFAIIETRFDPPPSILELISEVRARGCAAWEPLSQGSLSFGRGVQQNVNQGSTQSTFNANVGGANADLPLLPEFLPHHDQYSVLSGDYVRDLTPNGTLGFAQYQLRRYDTLRQYDSASLFAGVESPWRFGNWTVRGSAMLGLITLGGKAYQRQSQLQARVGVPLALPDGMQFSVLGSMTHLSYLTLDGFNSNMAELRGQFSYRKDENYSVAYLGYLDDRARGNRPGGDRRGWLASVQWRRRLGANWIGELAYSRQSWEGSQPYSPGFIDAVRQQTNHNLRMTLSYPLSRSHSLLLEGRLTRNRENISIFQYNDRQLQLSWQWQLP